MKKLWASAAVLVACASASIGLAHAQESKTPPQLIEEQRRNERADVDKRYNATVRRTEGDKSSQIDPWRTIRPAETTAKKTKPLAPR